MSDKYIKNNQEKTIDAFYKRVMYDGKISESQMKYTNLVNFNQGENFLFGRVDHYFTPLVLRQPTAKRLKKLSLNFCDSPTANLQAIDFVVEMFETLARQFQWAAREKKIATNDPYLTNLKAYKAYIDPSAQYNNYLEVFGKAVKQEFQQNNIVVRNFEGFMVDLIALMGKGLPTFPFTQTGYIKNKLCPINVSGLVIEIADAQYSNDEEKINTFVNSKNWDFYLNACNNAGFRVDANAPWRLVADIGAPSVRTLAARQETSGTSSNILPIRRLLSNYYTALPFVYFPRFRQDLHKLYNMVRKKKYVVDVLCHGEMTKKEVIQSTQYTLAQLRDAYPVSYFLEQYYTIRHLEERESRLSDTDYMQLVNECHQKYLISSWGPPLYFFERIINKPFDYRGSVGYIYKQKVAQVKLVDEEEARSATQHSNNHKG
tara:strand:- start:2037 stop:3329 length:1293 start_codon:yes stop_codon:yes gene_type:complete